MLIAHTYQPVSKDILIVTYNQPTYLKQCIKSIEDATEQYQIYVWDNGSNYWLEDHPDIKVTRSRSNEGFIIPNNQLIAQGNSPFVILLNDDTVVYPGWDKAMIGHIQSIGTAQVGYVGGWLDENAKGSRFGWGGGVDYIPGWCFAIPRTTYEKFGLFDEEFKFAYCEDADFSLRLTAAGERIYALHLGLVHHYENATIQAVAEKSDRSTSFRKNHAVLRERWSKRLAVSGCGVSV